MNIDIPTGPERPVPPTTLGGSQPSYSGPTFGQPMSAPTSFFPAPANPFSAPNTFQPPAPQYYPPQPQSAAPQNDGYYNPVDLSSPIAQLGMQGAKQFIGGMEMQTFAKRWFSSLKIYFAVNTSYVFSKLRIVTFPFMHKTWTRRLAQPEMTFLPPMHDINSPDLYIPLLAFVTYILLVGFFMGARLRFTPDVLGLTASTGMVAIIFEVLLLKALLFVFALTPVSFLDMIAYCGYKFVTATIIVVCGQLFGNLGFYSSFLLNTFLLAVFNVKTFRAVIPKQEGVSSVLRTNFLLILAGLQFLMVFFLCYFDFSAKMTTPILV